MMLRVVIGFVSMSVVVVSFVLCIELVSGKWRTIIGILNIFPVAIAYIICAGISYYTYNWRTMQFVISSPTLLLLCIWFRMPESPRLENKVYPVSFTPNIEFPFKLDGYWHVAESMSSLQCLKPRASGTAFPCRPTTRRLYTCRKPLLNVEFQLWIFSRKDTSERHS